MKLFPAKESLVGDIPADDEENDNLFLQCAEKASWYLAIEEKKETNRRKSRKINNVGNL